MKKTLFIGLLLLLTLQSYSQTAEDLINQAEEKYDNQKYAEAIKDLTMAIEIEPFNYVAITMRGMAKNQLGDYRGAISDYTKSILIYQVEDEYMVSIYNQMGTSRALLGDYEGAIKDFTRSIEIDPKFPFSYLARGMAKVSNNEKESGCEDFSRAGELGLETAYEYIRDLCN
ncbi:tetratricopeptide repeat protein [Algoriphagus formosus]|uniref:Tetratricopeptide repeat protein n=1 Tax=Algoriphagus formosus TaxID=2007308 RepID=A0A4R5VCV5_9BACT|nr:tetratricopeptide repeat protein [Algoriphagus aquimaris]TDK49526.1 tetratricopeptide repeat protein [Algoriphagus aquimaris]